MAHLSTPNPCRANRNIIIPESIGIASIALPTKVNSRNLRLDRAPLPLGSIGVGNTRLAGKPSNNLVIQPSLDSTVGSKVILEALPAAGGEGGGGGDTLRREVREGGVVGLAVVHEDLALAADAEVLVAALR